MMMNERTNEEGREGGREGGKERKKGAETNEGLHSLTHTPLTHWLAHTQ
jgi:hypothetical protein